MQISVLKISNILSFPPCETPADAVGVNFKLDEKLNILIGPNGSGKSNFIEIINQVFKKILFLPCIFNEDILREHKSPGYDFKRLKDVLAEAPKAIGLLHKNWYSSNPKKEIWLKIRLSENDFQNLEFLLTNASTINEIFSKYSHVSYRLRTDVTMDDIRTYDQIEIIIEDLQNSQQFSHRAQGIKELDFIHQYLQYFGFLKQIITVYNEYTKPEKAPAWHTLKNTFSLLGSYRNYSAFSGHISITESRSEPNRRYVDRYRDETTRNLDTQEPAVFDLVKNKLGYQFFQLLDFGGRSYALKEIENEELYKRINELLREYLSIEMKIEKTDQLNQNLNFYFTYIEQTQPINTQELSAGEKGILHFIFSLYGNDLENGVMIIDEPELHLHPQMQNIYLKIMQKIGTDFRMQFIVGTHSAFFVDKDTIKNVHRFYLDEQKNTKIVHPAIDENQKNLAKILDYTNSSRIFFVDKVILVEGESDEYFFRFYFDWLAQQDTEGIFKSYEVLKIGGKDALDTWKRFFEKFGLDVSFIGDWDNIEQITGFDIKTHKEHYLAAIQKTNKEIRKKGSIDGSNLLASICKYADDPSPENFKDLVAGKDYMLNRHFKYVDLIKEIKMNSPKEWTKIERRINAKYKKRLYILKHGELEDYLGIASKGLDQIIDFCEKDFDLWTKSKVFQEKSRELKKIAGSIFC